MRSPTEEKLLSELSALKSRVFELERRAGMRTVLCAGYCDQPTTEPGGMCQPCRERDAQEARRLMRMAP